MNTELIVTPGDWKTDGSADIVLVVANEQPIIECIFTSDPDLLDDDKREITREEAEANAHLVAAAKDMYNLLARILNNCLVEEIIEDSESIPGKDMYAQIVSVLKKARGETK